MKKRFKTYAFISLLILALLMTVSALKPQSSGAYFTAYDRAVGTRQVDYIRGQEFHENPKGLVKEVSCKNVGLVEEYFRVKVLAGTQIGITYEGEGWEVNADGYIYYTLPVAPGDSTGVLTLKLNPADNFKSDFNVVVAEEFVPAFYDINGNPYADWEAKEIEE